MLSQALEAFLSQQISLEAGDLLLVAFSGGPDSTALLAALAERAPAWPLRVEAAHLDHGLDEGSAGRAEIARRICEHLEVPLHLTRRCVPARRGQGESLEAAARRVRYGFLEEVRRRIGARYVATAHHRDDQAETLLLRLGFGSGLLGLSGIQPVRGRIIRPLLRVPRAALAAHAAAALPAGLGCALDPTNADLGQPRSRWRHLGLARLAGPGQAAALSDRLAGLAETAGRAREALERRLDAVLPPHPGHGGLTVSRRRLQELPEGLQGYALSRLHRLAGAAYPPPGGAREELRRQLTAGRRPGCDCGAGWRWDTVGDRLVLRRQQAQHPFFTYTFEVPGCVEIEDLALCLRLTPASAEDRPGAGRDRSGREQDGRGTGETAPRVLLALPLEPGGRVLVRNRRPGDRLRPYGRASTRRLKEVLIDSRVPRWERDRLPLLCLGEQIAWVPGVTLEEGFRWTGAKNGRAAAPWWAEIERLR